jgi:hypothetical protein
MIGTPVIVGRRHMRLEGPVTKPTIEIPLGATEIHATHGFRALAKLSAELERYEDSKLLVSCKNLRWFDAQLGAALQTVASHAQMRGNDIHLKDLQGSVRTILQKERNSQR